MRCFIYRNLNRKGHVYSFKALEGQYKGRVVAYAPAFLATDVLFHVSQSGWQRCLREQRRNVHAGIVGDVTLIDYAFIRLPNPIKVGTVFPSKHLGERITYNPYKTNGSFVVVSSTGSYERSVSTALRVEVFHTIIQAFGAK